MIKVANIKTFKPDGSTVFRVDRKSALGNPYTLLNEEDRDMVCDKYEKYFKRRVRELKYTQFGSELAYLRTISKTQDVTLVCWCAPLRCHADTIKRYLDKYVEEV